MNKLPSVALLLLSVLCTGAFQRSPMPTPPEKLDQEERSRFTTKMPTRRVDLAQLQQQADDLARTAQTIPADVASVRKGMLPKDVIAKLKQIEKLSKQLRNELDR